MFTENSNIKLANFFNPNAVAFSADNMSYLTWCAKLAYAKPETIKQRLEEYQLFCTDDFFFANEATGTEGFIVADEEKILLVFRGTESDKAIDWLTDAHAIKTEFSSENEMIGYVHRGFYDAFLSVWGMILPLLRRLRNKKQNIWIAGHSLGGALATLATATLSFGNFGLPVQGMYTFGQPRVGDEVFAEAFNMKIGHRCFRIVYDQDAVSFVPVYVLGYRHIGTLKQCDANCQLITDTLDDSETNNCSFDIAKHFRLMSVSDHSMTKYQDFALSLLWQVKQSLGKK